VRGNLQNRRLAMASRQRRKIWFRTAAGKLDRCPGEALEAKPGPNFLRIGRSVVMVQDDVSHGSDLHVFSASPRVRSQRVAASSSGIHGAYGACRLRKLLQSDPFVNEQPALPA